MGSEPRSQPTAEDARPLDPGAELLRRWQDEGDRDALDELLRLEIRILKEQLRRRADGMLDGSASMSDIAQDAVVRFLEVSAPPRFPTRAALHGYLWTSAWRLLIDHMRRPGRGMRPFDASDSGFGGDALMESGGLGLVEQRERAVAIDLALNLLRDSEREILRLVYFEHLDLEGAAERLGITHDAAKMRIMRARRALADKLRSWSELVD